MINIIAAMSKNHVIGRDGTIPWSIPRDLQFFRDMTENRAVIMGRKTWESLPVRPLPNRFNIVVTSRKDLMSGIQGIAGGLTDNLDMAITMAVTFGHQRIFLIGGGGIYQEAMERDLVDNMYLTVIHQNIKGDTYFPQINPFGWDVFTLEDHDDLQTNKLPYSIYHFSKRVK